MTEGSGLYLAGPGAGEGGDRPGDLARGPGRRPRARGDQRHRRLSRAGRRRLPGAAAAADRAVAARPGRRRSARSDRAAIAAGRGPVHDRPARTRRRSTMSATCSPRSSTAAGSTNTAPSIGRTLVCGFGRLGGIALGIVASQRLRFRPEGGGPFQFGGVIYGDSADKAARFVLDCNQSPAADPVHPGRQRLRRGPRRRAERASSAAGPSWSTR